MKVFISWSGDRSRQVAKALRKWLPHVIQRVDPWMSDEDISGGSRWLREIEDQLQETSYGIICLTPENVEEPWLNFEAGALAKSIDDSFVCPYLLDLEPSDVPPPLSSFQALPCTRDGTLQMLRAINGLFGENVLDDEMLDNVFGRFWEDLRDQLQDVDEAHEYKAPPREPEEMIKETLQEVRSISRRLEAGRPGSKEPNFSQVLTKYLEDDEGTESGSRKGRLGIDPSATSKLLRDFARNMHESESNDDDE